MAVTVSAARAPRRTIRPRQVVGYVLFWIVRPLVQLSNYVNTAGIRNEAALADAIWAEVTAAPTPTEYDGKHELQPMPEKRLEPIGGDSLDRWLMLEGLRIYRRGR